MTTQEQAIWIHCKTTDDILELSVTVDHREILTAHNDFKKAFNSEQCQSLWEILIHSYEDIWINSTATDTESNGKCGIFGFFPMISGMKMGCIFTPTLFNTHMNR